MTTGWAPTSPQFARHLAAALKLYASKLWLEDRVELPAELAELLEQCRLRARKGQEGPTLVDRHPDMSPSEPMQLLTTVEEAGLALRLGARTVKRLVATGELPSVMIGRARRVRVEDLARFAADLPKAPRPTGTGLAS